MKYLITLTLAFNFLLGFSQQLDTVYLTDNDFVVEFIESDYYSIVTQTNEAIEFKDYYNDSTPKSIRSYINKYGKPIPIGKLYKYKNYTSMIADGTFTFFDLSGVIYEITSYLNGAIVDGPFYFDTFGDTIDVNLDEKGIEKPMFRNTFTEDFH